MINIHPEAAFNFNSKSAELISSIKIGKLKISPSPFKIKPHSKMTITDKDIIGDISHSMTDEFGNKLGFRFKYNGDDIGIYGDDYKQLAILSNSIYKLKEINKYCSFKTIEKILCEWIKQRYCNPKFCDFTKHLQDEINKLINNFNVWIPIHYLHIQEIVKIGKITFKPITKNFIDSWESQLLQKNPLKEQDIKNFISSRVRPFQSYAAATISIKAEPDRAQEIALEETNRALNILRIFSSAAFLPRVFSPFAIWGCDRIDQSKIILFKNDEFYRFDIANIDPALKPEILDKELINNYYDTGLNIINTLLDSDSISPFSENVLSCLLIYSRCTTTKDISDKLIYILASLESIFLKNNSEAIQQNLGERIAFFIGESVDERRIIIKCVKDIYSLRSSFVHHGAIINNYEKMKEFMWYAWLTIIKLINTTSRFQTKEAFLDAVDNRKLA